MTYVPSTSLSSSSLASTFEIFAITVHLCVAELLSDENAVRTPMENVVGCSAAQHAVSLRRGVSPTLATFPLCSVLGWFVAIRVVHCDPSPHSILPTFTPQVPISTVRQCSMVPGKNTGNGVEPIFQSLTFCAFHFGASDLLSPSVPDIC